MLELHGTNIEVNQTKINVNTRYQYTISKSLLSTFKLTAKHVSDTYIGHGGREYTRTGDNRGW